MRVGRLLNVVICRERVILLKRLEHRALVSFHLREFRGQHGHCERREFLVDLECHRTPCEYD